MSTCGAASAAPIGDSDPGAMVVRATVARSRSAFGERSARSRRLAARRSELGVTVIEYALIAGLIAIAIVAGARLLGDEVDAAYDFVAAQVDAVM